MRRRNDPRLHDVGASRAGPGTRGAPTRAAVAAVLVACGACPAAGATDAPAATGRLRAVDVRLDNDSFATWPHDDGWYTSGLLVQWLRTADGDGAHARAARAACAWLGCGADARAYRLGSLTHRLMTPTDTDPSVPQPHDRPYAAWLALGAGVVVREPERQYRVELRLGALGPAALGEPTQNGVHRALGLDGAHGWDTQLRPRAVVQIGGSRLARLGAPGARFDAVHRIAAEAGTLFVHAALGAMLRLGSPPAAPDWPGEPAAAWADGGGRAWHLFAGGELRVVAVDRTIDGPAFGHGPRTEPKPFGGDLFAGAVLRVSRDWRLALTMTLRAVEFEAPDAPAERAQRFATLAAHWAGR